MSGARIYCMAVTAKYTGRLLRTIHVEATSMDAAFTKARSQLDIVYEVCNAGRMIEVVR